MARKTADGIDTQGAPILAFWRNEVGEKGWYTQSDAVDAQISARFGDLWADTLSRPEEVLIASADQALAYIILLDQFPRNMFRGDARAFATDARARGLAKWAIARDYDLAIDGPMRQFFYLPLMHAEGLPDQERGVRLFLSRMPEAPEQLIHAIAHRDVIRRFGRFPYRNAALGRTSTAKEETFLADEGYGRVVEKVRAAR